MSQSQPEADNCPGVGVKRPKMDPDTVTLDPNIKIEPDAKRQKIDNEVPDATQKRLEIVDIDPEGDLTIIFESKNTGFKFDSNALKRASPILYQECLAVRPDDDSAWTFRGVPDFMVDATGIILYVIHGNIDKVPESMKCVLVHNIVSFAKAYGMKDGLLRSMRQWFFAARQPTSNKETIDKISGLWITNELGLETEFRDFQSWAVFNLTPDGNGLIGDPRQAIHGLPVHMKMFRLHDAKITERIIRLRSGAVDMIIKNLKEVQLAMIPTGVFGKDGRIRNKFGGHACARCLDLWFAHLGKSLLHPRWLDTTRWDGFPSLSHATEAKEYQLPLEELCTFIEAIQFKMDSSTACSRMGQAACQPTQLVGRVAVQGLISRGLVGPISSA